MSGIPFISQIHHIYVTSSSQAVWQSSRTSIGLHKKPLTCSAGRKYWNRAFQAIREPVLRGLSWCRE
jgi:hypothetical protein